MKSSIIKNAQTFLTESATTRAIMADKRKLIIWVAALSVPFGLMPGPRGLVLMFSGVWIALNILGIVFSCQLAGMMGKKQWLWLLATLVPLFNLVAFARIVNQSGKALKAKGFRSEALPNTIIEVGGEEISADLR